MSQTETKGRGFGFYLVFCKNPPPVTPFGFYLLDGKNQTPECSPVFGGPQTRNPLIAGGAVLTSNMVFEKP